MAKPELHKLAEGREAEIFAWRDGAVLRLLRNPSAHRQVEWEAAAMEAARACGCPVPAVRGVTTVQGRPGLVMEHIEGRDLLTVIGRRPQILFRAARTLAEVHVRLHAADAPDSLPSLRDRLRERITGSRRVPEQLARFALDDLASLPDGESIYHGDFHPGNIIMTRDGPVVIDWTNVTRGDPSADLARTRLMLLLGEPPPGYPRVARFLALVGRRVFFSAYLRSYRRLRPVDMRLVDRWEVPVAANRLTEGIEEERGRLLALLERRLGASAEPRT